MRITINHRFAGFCVKRLERPTLGPWVNIYLGNSELDSSGSIELITVAECDELIKAAVEAKRLLTPGPDATAIVAAAIAQAKAEARPLDPACRVPTPTPRSARDVSFICTRTPGHDGPHVALGSDNGDGIPLVWPQAQPEASAADAAAIETGTPVIVTDDEDDDLTPEVVSDLLALAGVTIPLPVIAGWTAGQRNEAAEWAGTEHLHASDNDVDRLPKPDHVTDAAASLVGRLVEDAHDDSPCPTVGLVVSQVDEDTLEVAWGAQRSMANPLTHHEPFDALRPAREASRT